jgi:hypothetical protein
MKLNGNLWSALFGVAAILLLQQHGAADVGTPQGTTYSVTHEVGSQNPMPQCFPIPTQPGGDDIVTFDELPEQLRMYFNGAMPVVTEEAEVIGNETHITIQTSVPLGQQLFPGGLIGPQGQPLTDACFKLGHQDPLDWNGDKQVSQARIEFFRDAMSVTGPIDVSGPAYFATPWNGQFAFQLPGGAGPALNINRVVLFLVCEVVPLECGADSDCDDGDPCTVDKCINNACVHIPLKDTLSREEALRASHGPNKDCFPSGGYPIPLPGDILPGGARDDRWQTYPHCDGSTQWKVGQNAGDPPIPADFFAPGSEPFTGIINFQGLPLGLPGMDEVDTVVRRSADPFSRSDLPGPTEVTVEIELVQLSLVSCSPITVNHSGGSTTQWNVKAELSACPPPAGTLTARKTHCNGGTFTSVLNVQPTLTFTRVDDPGDVKVLDTGCVDPPFPFDTLVPPDPIAWVHDISPKLWVVDNYASAFHAGLPEGMSSVCGDYDVDNDNDVDDFMALLKTYGHVAGEPEYHPWIDYDVNGIVDYEDYLEWLACHRCGVGDPSAKPPMPGNLGDMNANGTVRGDDIPGFIRAVTGTPTILGLRGDIDQNGSVDLRDTPGFVLLLLELN